MGVLGEMFPGRKITDEAGEAGEGEPPFRLGPIDLDNNTVVVVQRGTDAEPPVTPTVETAVRSVDYDADRKYQTGPTGPPQG
jgi:hypothetical protein